LGPAGATGYRRGQDISVHSDPSHLEGQLGHWVRKEFAAVPSTEAAKQNWEDGQVLLTETEVRRSIGRAEEAFPRLSGWNHANRIDETYSGFCLWGELILDPNEPMPRRFYVTFDTFEATWAGHLTIGQPNYFWTSADAGDAHLVDTDRCATLEEAIDALRSRIGDLFLSLSGTT